MNGEVCVLDRRDVLDFMHGRSRGGGGSDPFLKYRVVYFLLFEYAIGNTHMAEQHAARSGVPAYDTYGTGLAGKANVLRTVLHYTT